jgi:hypothetical protein
MFLIVEFTFFLAKEPKIQNIPKSGKPWPQIFQIMGPTPYKVQHQGLLPSKKSDRDEADRSPQSNAQGKDCVEFYPHFSVHLNSAVSRCTPPVLIQMKVDSKT